uniref:Fascin n=2 Tax=Ciona intestinalis TaxID=7719 RepID=F6WYV6_CIOIN
YTMGELSEALQFTFGLINSSNKYLTAETFGFKIAASGASLKKKQTWSLEQEPNGGNDVYFKSFLGRYLGADKNGKVSCDTETPSEENKFQVEATTDGRWAIKSSKYERYFGGSGDNLSCFEQTISNTYLWVIHLAMHPQVNICNIRRKCYAHLSPNGEEVHMTKRTPWGEDTLITLLFKDKGYALVTSNSKYLGYDGTLHAEPKGQECLFTIEFYSGKIAFKSKHDGRYLSPVGPKGQLQGRKDKPGKDEEFALIDSHPQITLFSKTKGKYVSGKQGLQLSANQIDAEESETFQMEIDPATEKVFFRNDKEKYWRLDGQSILADAADTNNANTHFVVEWHGRFIRLVASNGNYVSIKPSGHLFAPSKDAEDFTFRLTNRAIIVFRGEHGFVGCKGDKLEGNRATYDIFQMEENDGAYGIKAPNGKYWAVDGDKKVAATGSQAQPFLIQLTKNSKLALKPENGDVYVTSDHVGIMTASGSGIDKKTLFEY